MRPIVSEQDFLRNPLNELFGTQSHVRLLRVMANEVDGPLATSDAARRAGMTVPGAQKALERLLRSGFISRVGGGRKHQYQIRFSNKLMQTVSALFQEEKDRYEQLIGTIKIEIKNLKPHPYAAWIKVHSKEVGEPLTLGLLHDTRHLTNCVQQLRTRLNLVENDFDLTIELEGYTKADLFDQPFNDITVLYGVLPSTNSPSRQHTPPLTHSEKDQRLNAISRRLAEAIKQDSSLLLRAKAHIDRLLKEDPGTAAKDLIEWRDILDLYPPQRLSRFLTSDSERANRLRQSNPFFAILNADERARLINDMEGSDDT
jgi:predicted transcriptional regulator